MANGNIATACRKTLWEVGNGLTVRIKALEGDPFVCHRLREMGFCECAHVRRINANGALLCRVKAATVAISENLARRILVEA